MKKSITSRIKITKTGKMIRRLMGQSHFKAKKTGKQVRQKRITAEVSGIDRRMFRKYISLTATTN